MPKKRFIGTVVSNKMNKTIVVAVESLIKHPVYKKYIKRTKKYHAHDEQDACHIGDTVEIVESRPLSKTKKWRVLRVVKRAVLGADQKASAEEGEES